MSRSSGATGAAVGDAPASPGFADTENTFLDSESAPVGYKLNLAAAAAARAAAPALAE